MRALVLALAAALAVPAPLAAQSAPQRLEQGPSRPVRVQLDSMPIGALATMLMRDVLKVPYVISSEVLADNSRVSVNLVMPRGELPARVVGFLRGVGLTVRLDGGTVYVSKPTERLGVSGQAVAPPAPYPAPVAGAPHVPSGSPLAPHDPQPSRVAAAGLPGHLQPSGDALAGSEGPSVVAILEPAHVPVMALVDVIESVLPEITMAARRDSDPQNGQIVDRAEAEQLVLTGPADSIEQAIAIARHIDRPKALVEIRAVVFEVRNSRTRSSALSILAQLGDLEVGSNLGGVPGEQFLRIATNGIEAVLSATRGDGRFRIVAEPSLAALSGSVARINSGSQVPTLGSVSFTDDGQPIRSVEYRDSGISLTVRPVVRPGGIELEVQQERSSFVRTNTGVNDSPTLNRSIASTRIALMPGETVAIAGLDEESTGDTRAGFLGGLLGSRERSNDKGQLLLLLQADLADQQRIGELRVTRLEPVEPEPSAQVPA